MRNLQSRRVELDKTTSLIPLLSTLTNGVSLVQKLCILPKLSPQEIEKNIYYSYLQNKSINRIALEMIPLIGNAYAFYQQNLWSRPEFVLKQIQQNPSNLLRASSDLQYDIQFLLQAYTQNKKIIDFTIPEIKEKDMEFYLGTLAIHRKEIAEFQKKLDNLCLDYEIYRDCSDNLQPLIKEPSIPRKKKSSLQFLYAHARTDYNESYDKLQNSLEKNKEISKNITAQDARLQDVNSEIKNDISPNFSKADEIVEEMKNIPLYLKAPGYILNRMNVLLDTSLKAISYLIR